MGGRYVCSVSEPTPLRAPARLCRGIFGTDQRASTEALTWRSLRIIPVQQIPEIGVRTRWARHGPRGFGRWLRCLVRRFGCWCRVHARRSNSLFARPALMRPSCFSLSADRPGPRIRTDYSMFWSAQRVFTARHVAARITRSGAGASAAAEARPGPLGAFRGPTACKATRRRVSEVPVAGWATKSRRSRVRRGRSGGDRGAGYFTKRLAEDWPRDVLHEAR